MNINGHIPTKEVLDQLFWVEDGKIFRKVRTANCIQAGSRADRKGRSGYRSIYVNGKRVSAHRVIFMMEYGWLPKEIDHIDRDPENNKIENLRAATHAQNLCNVPTRAKSGIKGVHWHKASNSWSACIGTGGKLKHLGLFKSKEDAHQARIEASKKYHGEFASIEPRAE